MESVRAIPRPQSVVSDCSFLLDESGQHFTYSGRKFAITPTSEFTHDGSPILPEEMNIGTRATITIGSGNAIKSGEVTFLTRRATLLQLFSEAVIVFSLKKFRTTLMQKMFEGNEEKEPAARYLMEKFFAVRRVGGEGMLGFWTAMGLAYLDHLMLPCVQLSRLNSFYQMLQEANETRLIDPYLNTLYAAKQRNQGNAVLDSYYSDGGFLIALVASIKALLVSYATAHPEKDAAMICLIDGEEAFRNTLEYQHDLSQELILLTAWALGVKLKVYDYYVIEQLGTAYECDEDREDNVRVDLLLKSNTFYVFYTEAQCIAEGFDPMLEKRELKQVPEFMEKSLYYTLKKREEIQSGQLEAEKESLLKEIQQHLTLESTLQTFVLTSFSVLENKEMPEGVTFSTKSLIEATYAVKAKYLKHMALIRNSAISFEDEQRLSLLGKPDTAFSKLSGMKICNKCQEHPGATLLKCGDFICKICFDEYLIERQNQGSRIVEVDGEPCEDLKCPLRTCLNAETITKSALMMVVGDLQPYITYSENMSMTKKCKRCGTIQSRDAFSLTSYCGCKICCYCIIDLFQNHDGVCECKKFIPIEVSEHLSQSFIMCQGCGGKKSLITDFSPVKCKDHILCRMCLESAMMNNARCPMCYRIFTAEEQHQAESFFMLQCMLFCRKFIPSKQILQLSCGCHFCNDCALNCMYRLQNIDQCYSCYQYLNQRDADMVKQMTIEQTIKMCMKPVSKQSANVCPLCYGPVGVVQEFKLKCEHLFHKKCIVDYVDTYLGTAFDEVVKCPESKCTEEIDGGILEHEILGYERYGKYSERLAMKDTVQCPFCRASFYLEGEGGIECQFCHKMFCTECKQAWDPNHDQTICNFNLLLDKINMLVASVNGNEDHVAQCPGCKLPYTKNENTCAKVKCVKEGCVDWCFGCSALHNPIVFHGPAWHRPDCQDYKMDDLSTKVMVDQCGECKKLGRLCDPPKSLKVPRRFAIDEN